MAVLTLLYECKTWTLIKMDYHCIEAAELNFLRAVTSYTFADHERNVELTEIDVLRVYDVSDKIQAYIKKWIDHLD